MTKILKCNCQHVMQDRLHGNHMRVFNITGDGKSARCTVCESTQNIQPSDKEKNVK